MITDEQLLRAYTHGRSEAAFTELVGRHVDLVYSTALRTVGEPQSAQDVAQSVFLHLARKAGSIRKPNALPGWLYCVARDQAANAVRAERRWRRREQQAVTMNAIPNEETPAWREIAPLLEEAMRTLARRDQDAVVLRFLRGQSLRQVGEALELSEDAAQKRLSRALERLRDYFARRGVKVSATVLASGLAAHAIEAAPAGVGAAISTAVITSGAALSAAGTLGFVESGPTKAVLMTTTQKVTVTALLTLAVGTGIFQAHRAGQMRTQLSQVEGRLQPLTEEANQLRHERDQAAAELRAAQYQLQDHSTELARLRGEVARLRTEAQALARSSTAGRQEPEAEGVRLRKENLRRVQFAALNDNFELTETSKDLLQLTPEESARITASLQAFKQRIQEHDLAQVRQVPAEEVKGEDIVRFLKRNTGQPTAYRIPPFSPQEQQALKEWFGQQLDQIVGGERSRLLVKNAKLSLDFWLGGTEDKILAFVNPADAGESPVSAWMVKFNTPSSHGTNNGGSRSEPVPPQLRYLFEIHQPPKQ